ncbi:hypothetical protein [Hyalangium rubrum]|uniref:Lipoprotein n=1 Tax=Hyalangium rubrum TaxID=3103134 RepID=A0ABU5H550_9BACT|nr:hypothetical protein [Hyalangium sp. s54d21]MDY7228588.1 hypothetical protein [Hyalangium sp. s54d21]
MKMSCMKVLGSLLVLSLAACGGTEAEPEPLTPEEGEVSAMATCYAYLLDGANFSGAQLAPWPVTGGVGSCINLPAVSDNRTSSFRLAGCAAAFFDGPGCTGASFVAPTSANMPVGFDNLTTSLRFQ